MKNTVHSAFNELIKSVRYIHEHPIAYLKRQIQHNPVDEYIDDSSFYGDENFYNSQNKPSSEIDLIKIDSTMQTHLFDIVEIFDQTKMDLSLTLVKERFSRRINKGYHVINLFKSHSLDAQDGILVENQKDMIVKYNAHT